MKYYAKMRLKSIWLIKYYSQIPNSFWDTQDDIIISPENFKLKNFSTHAFLNIFVEIYQFAEKNYFNRDNSTVVTIEWPIYTG